MRTKTLLLAVTAFAAGLVASTAQTVYSVNAVGYVNLTFPNGGLALVDNPLDGTNNLLNTILPSVPNDTLLYRFNPSSGIYYDAESFIDVSVGWFDGGGNPSTTVLAPGEGFFLKFPDTSSVTVTFVGQVPQGALSNPIPAQYSLRSSQVPQSLGLSAMGFPADPDDLVYFWSYSGQTWKDAISYVGGGQWVDFGSGNLLDPAPAVGEGFFVVKANAANWTRTFSVN
jgi:hypothetical protein